MNTPSSVQRGYQNCRNCSFCRDCRGAWHSRPAAVY